MKKTILTLVTFLTTVTILTAQQAEKKNIYFNYDKYELTADSKVQLEKICKSVGEKEITKLEIAGYTDSDGSNQYNDSLSKNRALSVLDFLTAKGFAKSNIKVEYYGERQPDASNESAEGREQNRRVEIILQYADFSVPKEFIAKPKTFTINPNSDTAVALSSKGTVLHVPKNCFADMHGNVVKENVTIAYTEFNNSADMAFSNIPMTYKTMEEEFFFNSSGMFEIKGSVNNNPVQVAKNKSMKVDFALAKKNPDIGFYQLKENGDWKKVQDIEAVKRDTFVAVATDEFIPIGQWVKDTVFFGNGIVFVNGGGTNFSQGGSRKIGSLLASGANAGHTYPDIIRGLNVDSFGVYNCDQIYRVPSVVSIEATYLDNEGKKINNLYVLSLIDLKYNGAFSFSPSNFQCSAKGENVLALFTKDKKLYVLDKSEFAKMKIDKSGHYTFTMKDMTERIKDSKDLANYLGIKL